MNTLCGMKISHDNLTKDQLEEWVEFIDWSKIPSRLLTEDIRKKFKDLSGLQVRMYLEDFLNSLEVKIDKRKYPDYIFFFRKGKWCIYFDKTNGTVGCSEEHMWTIIGSKLKYRLDQIREFIQNVLEQYIQNKEVSPEQETCHQLFKHHFSTNRVKITRLWVSDQNSIQRYFTEKSFF